MEMEIYWVGSDGENLEKMYFNVGDALDSDHRYLDSFDANGSHTKAYVLENDRYVECS